MDHAYNVVRGYYAYPQFRAMYRQRLHEINRHRYWGFVERPRQLAIAHDQWHRSLVNDTSETFKPANLAISVFGSLCHQLVLEDTCMPMDLPNRATLSPRDTEKLDFIHDHAREFFAIDASLSILRQCAPQQLIILQSIPFERVERTCRIIKADRQQAKNVVELTGYSSTFVE